MKVSLVVASGAHEGRLIPLTGPQFLIGRDQQCHLRPASPAISKLHCAVIVRDGKVYVKDFGSTNGTLVNDGLVQNAEVLVADGAGLRVGPLDFRVQIEASAPTRDGTPLPGSSPEAAAALAAVKAATGATSSAKPPARDTTPNPARTSGATPQPTKSAAPTPTKPGGPKDGSKEAAALKKDGSKEAPAVKPAPAAVPGEGPSLTSSESVSEEDHDRIAAMLLGMDDQGNGSVPEGSTVMDLPTPLADNASGATVIDPVTGEPKPAEPKKDEKPKVAQTREEMSSAASDLLRKYMRRPK
jgi:pSer/pThr/pTyr-binding forkhead associated (FHA) protein